MSRLRLGLETSTTNFAVALTEGSHLVASVSADIRETMTVDLRGLVQKLLADAGRSLRDLELVLVDRGPGHLSAVRSGVAFANAIAFSARVPIVGVSSFVLMYEAATMHRDLPWLCFRKASGEQHYGGLVSAGRLTELFYGSVEQIVAQADVQGTVVLAGSSRAALVGQFIDAQAVDGGPTAPLLQGLVTCMLDPKLFVPQQVELVMPITEQTKA